MIKKILIGLMLGTIWLFANNGLEIMNKVLDRDDGDNVISSLQMQLIDKNGQKRIKNLKTYSKDIGKDTKKVMFFTSPSNIKNTSFLTYDYNDDKKDDDQWLYLPALKKTKRIPASDKDGSFMGSDFTYFDMTKPNLSDFNIKFLKEGMVKRKSEKTPVWIIEIKPKNDDILEQTGYLKSIVYVRKDNYMITRAKHYLKKGKRIKYMDVKKMTTIDGIGFNLTTTMTTKQDRIILHKTILINSSIKLNQNLKESFFSIRTIEKGL